MPAPLAAQWDRLAPGPAVLRLLPAGNAAAAAADWAAGVRTADGLRRQAEPSRGPLQGAAGGGGDARAGKRARGGGRGGSDSDEGGGPPAAARAGAERGRKRGRGAAAPPMRHAAAAPAAAAAARRDPSFPGWGRARAPAAAGLEAAGRRGGAAGAGWRG
jgi:hypothetical protein